MDTVTRRNFIKSVIAAGATASSVTYLFRGSGALIGQTSVPGAVERLILATLMKGAEYMRGA